MTAELMKVELLNAGVRIPTSLDMCGVSMYHYVTFKSLAIHLYDMGFRNIEEYDCNGRTPLISLICSCQEWDELGYEPVLLVEALDLAECFLGLFQNNIPLRLYREHDISLLHIAAYHEVIRLPLVYLYLLERLVSGLAKKVLKSQWIDPVFSEIRQPHQHFRTDILIIAPQLLLCIQKTPSVDPDNCRCGCSRYGCTPITAFLKGLYAKFNLNSPVSLYIYRCLAVIYNW